MKVILVPVDFSDVTLKVVKAAVQLARPFQSRIMLMHVSETAAVPLPIPIGADVAQGSEAKDKGADARARLAALQEMITSVGLDSTSLELRGSPVEQIMAHAHSARVDLIVLGSHSRGPFYHLFVGGVTEGILKRARCPVLVVPLSESAG